MINYPVPNGRLLFYDVAGYLICRYKLVYSPLEGLQWVEFHVALCIKNMIMNTN